MSIEDTLAKIESTFLIGREKELATLRGLIARCDESVAVAYVHGPAGVGKTALLTALAYSEVPEAGTERILVQLRKVRGTAESVFRQVAQQLYLPREEEFSRSSVCAAIARRAQDGRILLVIDDYDAVGSDEAYVREQLIYSLPAGVTVVLSGRMHPSTLWPLERAWRRFVTMVPLKDLPRMDVDRILRDQGVLDSAILDEVFVLTDGRPALIARAADALIADGPTAATSDATAPAGPPPPGMDLSSLLLERILHPGSQRSAWRPLSGEDEFDTVVAALSLLPAFRRDLLQAVTGVDIDPIWERVERLPCFPESGGWYRLPDRLRARIAQVVRREHPWLSDQWVRRAFAFCARRGKSCSQGTGEEVGFRLGLEIARGPVAQRALSSRVPPGAQRYVSVGELSQLCEGDMHLRELVTSVGDGARDGFALRSTEGRALSALIAAPVEDCPSRLLPEDSRQAGAAVLICLATLSDFAWPLLEETSAVFHEFPMLLATGSSAIGEVFGQLGFTRSGTHSRWWRLDLRERTCERWLDDLATAQSAPASVMNPAALAKQALQALSAQEDLLLTDAASVFRRRHGEPAHDDLRNWLLDALRCADLGEQPCDGRTLLSMYYLERVGSHETIAERLDLPRATYFRTYRSVLARLGEALFGV